MLATTNGPDCFSCSLQIRRWRRARLDDLRSRPTLPSANHASDGVATGDDGDVAASLARSRPSSISPSKGREEEEEDEKEEKEEVEGRRRGESLESGAKKERFLALL